MKHFLNGLFAGAVATAPMSLVMLVLHRFPTREPQALPPEQITQTLVEEVSAQTGSGQHLDKPQLQALTLANHFGFGAAAGGVYALLSPRVAAPPVLKGAVWGMVVRCPTWAGYPLRASCRPRRSSPRAATS